MALSSTNKTIQQICLPFLFDELALTTEYNEQDAYDAPGKKLQALNDVVGDVNRMLTFVKYIPSPLIPSHT